MHPVYFNGKARTVEVYARRLQLQEQLNDINSYAVSLRKEQQELAIIRHDSRHQLRMLAELAENGEFEEAEKHLLELRKEVADK